MIGEIIKKPGEKGSGGGRDAFAPGVHYVCGKATRVELRNLCSGDWQNAAKEMLLTSELSSRVQKPYYHLVLSWHPLERPTEDQMVEAMDHLVRTLGLEDHQVVIGIHNDTPRRHIHAVVNTVHPTTGKTWSKSNDQQKAELACREIEMKQGWSHDRGRFDFDVTDENGELTVSLRRNDDVWEKKKQDRAKGAREPSAGDIAFQKHHGFAAFSQDIPPALKDRFAQAVAKAQDWNSLHRTLATLGLRYRKHGSGARVHLAGSAEFAKASAFGQAFSINTLQRKFGPYRDPASEPESDSGPVHVETAGVTGTTSKEDEKTARSAAFKLTLLRRMYTGLHLDDQVAQQIRYVDLSGKPPQITFQDNSTVVDHGNRISTSAVTQATIKATVAMAKAKGWSAIVPSGPPEYIRGIAVEAARCGLPVTGVSPEIQTLADEILERERKKASRLAREADAALKDHLDTSADRERAIEANITEEARKATEAILGGTQPKPAEDTPPRKPGRPPVASPQPAPDASRHDRDGTHRLQQQVRANDWSELEDMKRTDIGVIAGLGGWSDVSRTHRDSSDPHGTRYRIYTRGNDTLKCSRIDGKWLWTSNKSGQSGSVIDLWLQDNPGKTVGHARTAFRAILGTGPLPTPAAPAPRIPERDDHTDARRRWQEAPHFTSTARSYAEERGISRSTLERFPDEVRSGVFGGVYFAHRNLDTGDITGFEQRWEKDGRKNAARFAKGGRKTVNVLGDPVTATRMVVVEGGLDALALAELEARLDTIYVSTGGGFGPMTEAALRRLADSRKVFSGFDNDDAGAAMHEKLRALLPTVVRHAPPAQISGSTSVCKDWLDVLNAGREMRAEPIKATPPDARETGPGLIPEVHDLEPPLDESEAPEFF
ncbi:relaxase/mobilization nuclease domain-containing protein [Paracoccaceae bacterium Fryx2]|nr:relaxase/mobilization nuclease domain-containing protein [Paracoccaceae bacterium Fryx2]